MAWYVKDNNCIDMKIRNRFWAPSSFANCGAIMHGCINARSDNERLQSLTKKQARQIEDHLMYIQELEDRERVLSQNVSFY